jgi:hypothetical protein
VLFSRAPIAPRNSERVAIARRTKENRRVSRPLLSSNGIASSFAAMNSQRQVIVQNAQARELHLHLLLVLVAVAK